MGLNYSDYISGATSRLVDLLSSNQIQREEKELLISSLTDNLTDNVFSPEKIEQHDVLFAKNSLLYIDDRLYKFQSMQPLNQEQLNEVVLLCERQKQNMLFLSSENISLPKINILNIDQFCDEIKVNYDNNCLMMKTLQLDILITDSLKKTSYNDEECNYLFSLLDEMDKNINECKKRRIKYTNLENTATVTIREKIINNRTRIENDSYFAKVVDLDEKISKCLDGLEKSSKDPTDIIIPLLEEMDLKLAECKKRRININKIKNKNTDSIRKRIADYKQAISDRSKLLDEIANIDSEIVNTCKMWPTDSNCLAKIVSLCDKCATLLGICNVRGWDVPKLKCNNPSVTKDKYLLYDEMTKTDKIIFDLASDLSKDNYKSLVSNVTKQRGNILTCSQNKWTVPELMVKDLDGTLIQYNKSLAKTHGKSTMKLVLVLVTVFIVIIFGLFIWLDYRYTSTHTRMPINQMESIGNDYRDIVSELEAAGFNNVVVSPVSSGIQQSGAVVGITVDENDTFWEDHYYPNQAKIVVSYSSEDRINLTSTLEDWNQKSVNYMDNVLKGKGCVVDRKEVKNTMLSSNNLVSALVINGVDYSSGDCYVPEGAKVTIYYYAKMCEIRKSAKDIIGEDYIEIRTELLALGFDNIKLVKKDDLITGWVNKDRSIYSITINGEDGFKSGELFHHSAEIIITVHTYSDTDYPYIDY